MGRRGGGNKLLCSLIDNLKQEDIAHRFIISQRNESISSYSQKENVNVIKTSSLGSLFKDSWREVHNKRDNYVFVMQHPHDIFIWMLTKIFRHSRTLMVHDDKRHKGDPYPRTLGLRLRARNSTQRIFFTEYVQSQYPSKKNDFIWRYFHCENKKRVVPAENYLLTIGRLRKYQGIHLIPKIIENLNINFDRWTIAGNSKFLSADPRTRIEVNCEWLSEDEIDSYIASARVVVLPYIEASQSGMLPRIASFGVPTVITPVGGLPEQVEELQKCVIAEGNSELSIARAIEMAWEVKEISDAEVSESNQNTVMQQLIMYLKSCEGE
jgi:glycosyltransferase involved in cell wall biosynthesis